MTQVLTNSNKCVDLICTYFRHLQEGKSFYVIGANYSLSNRGNFVLPLVSYVACASVTDDDRRRQTPATICT